MHLKFCVLFIHATAVRCSPLQSLTRLLLRTSMTNMRDSTSSTQLHPSLSVAPSATSSLSHQRQYLFSVILWQYTSGHAIIQLVKWCSLPYDTSLVVKPSPHQAEAAHHENPYSLLRVSVNIPAQLSTALENNRCRSRRRKCRITPGHRRCQLCETQDLECSRAGAFAPSSHSVTTYANRPEIAGHVLEKEQNSGPNIWDKTVCVELVGLYFTYIHDQFHSLFHRPSFMLDLEREKAPKVLVYAMMAMSARYLPILSSIYEMFSSS